jgi:hypothetical protein
MHRASTLAANLRNKEEGTKLRPVGRTSVGGNAAGGKNLNI